MSVTENASTLVLSGGGSKGIYHLGAMRYLEERKCLSKVDTYVGCSVGTVISFLHSFGLSSLEIFGLVTEFNKSLVDVSKFNLNTFISTYGLSTLDTMIGHVQDIMINLNISPNLTLKQHKELTHKHLIISVTNVTLMKSEYLDYTSHPSLRCLDALRISCSVPVIFPYVNMNENIYVDGGLSDNYPIEFIDDGKRNIIGIYLDDMSHVNDFLGYVTTIMRIPYQKLYKEKIKKLSRKCVHLELQNDVASFSIGNPDNSTKIEMFISGYNQCEKILKKLV